MNTRSLSDLLNDLKSHCTAETTKVKTVLEAFHERGFGFVLFIIALPAALPLPALGINTIIALPLMILTGQQAIGRHTVWIPESWRNKEISSKRIHGFVDKALPWVKKLEFFVRPRLGFMTQGIFSNLIGIFGFFMALAVAVPIPLTNTVPSFGIAVMAIGVLMRDGLAVIIGAAIGLLWILLLSWAVVYFGSEAFDIVKNMIKGFI